MRHRPLQTVAALCVAVAVMGQAVRAIGEIGSQEEASAMPNASRVVTITDGGFTPSIITVTLGSAVVWVSAMLEPGHLAYGDPKRTLVPLSSGNAVRLSPASANSAAAVGEAAAPPAANVAAGLQWGSINLAPGASFTYTFSLPGVYRAYVPEHPERSGLVVVQDGILFPQPAPTPLAAPTPAPQPSPTPGASPLLPSVAVPAAIASDTTWQAGRVYVVSGPTAVNLGVRLTIEPGAIIKFRNNSSPGNTKGKLTVHGTLLAWGSRDQPIVFTSVHDDTRGGDTNLNGGASWPASGDWDGLLINSSGSGSVLENALIMYGGKEANLAVNGAAVTVRDSVVSHSSTSGLKWMNGASGAISGTRVEHNLLHGVHLAAGSSPALTGDILAHNQLYAVYAEGNCFPELRAGAAYGNGYNGVGVYGSVGTGTWGNGLAYIATQNLPIEPGSVLTIQAGSTVKFLPNTTLIVRGALAAGGTASLPIVFTSVKDDSYGGDTQQDGAASKPAPGDWGTLYFADNADDAASRLEYAVVRYGGATYNYGSGSSNANLTLDSASPRVLNTRFERSGKYGAQLLNVSSPEFRRNTLSDNASHGVWLSPSSAPQVRDNLLVRNGGFGIYVTGSSQAVFGGNIAAGNKVNGIGLAGTLNSDTAWEYDLPYVIDGSFTVDLNTTLTILPGVTVKLGIDGLFTVNGALRAQGDADHRVVFTSLKDDAAAGDTNGDGGASVPAPGDWNTIRFAPTAGASVLENVSVRYGGKFASTGAVFLDGSAPALTSLAVMGSKYRGVYVYNAGPVIEGGVFSQNAVGVYNGPNGTATVRRCDFSGNTQYAVYNGNAFHTLDAPDNWWGASSGPAHVNNPEGIGERAGGPVSYAPWQTGLPPTRVAPLPSPSLLPITFTQVGGAIASNTDWVVTRSPYLVANDVTVNPGARLTIDPGVVVKFAAGKSLIVNGILIAVGLPDRRIVFTSAKDDSVKGDTNGDGTATWPQPGDWGRIQFSDSSDDSLTRLTYAEVRYGGAGATAISPGISALFLDSASAEISDNLIVQNKGYGLLARNSAAPPVSRNWILDNTTGGIRLEQNSGGRIVDNQLWGNGRHAVSMDGTCYPAFEGNKARYNDVDGIVVNGTVSANQTWHANLPYVIDGSLTINNGPALTLSPGTVVKFTPKSKLTVNGALVASTAAEPAVFTSLMDDAWGGDTNNDDGATWPQPGDWDTITFADASDDGRNVLDHVIVRYARAGLTINSAAPRILNSQFTHALQYGIDIENNSSPWLEGIQASDNAIAGISIAGNSAPVVSGALLARNRVAAIEMAADSIPSFAGNTMTDNTLNGIFVYGAVNGNVLWPKTNPYILSLLTIPVDGSLTLSAGQVIKLAPQGVIAVNGSLFARGASGAPVVFTSLKDDAWGGDTNNDGIVNLPAPGDWRSINIASTGVVSLHHSIVRYGDDLTAKAAIVNSGSLAVGYSEVTHSGTVGIYNMKGAASAFVHDSNLYGHPNYGIYNADPDVRVVAQRNWWGASDGPKPYGTGDGVNYRQCRDEFGNLFVCQYYVEASPWLTAPALIGASVNASAPCAEPASPAADAEDGSFSIGAALDD